MPYYEHEPGGGIVMLCQVCGTRCHADGSKKVCVHDEQSGHYRNAECPLCVCHDCVQLADDPLRKKIAPLLLGQTMEEGVNKLADGTTERRPGRFNIKQALTEAKLALSFVDRPRHALPRSASCECGEPARSRCISCDEALCGRCVKDHKCQKPSSLNQRSP